MQYESRPNAGKRAVLTTDLDGTLIPLEGNVQNHNDLEKLKTQLTAAQIPLVFVTGRHLEIVEQAIAEESLPIPQWIICDVGTTICERAAEGWQPMVSYADHLAGICAPLPLPALQQELTAVDRLTLQEPQKQGAFKLSYYVDQTHLESIAEAVSKVIARNRAPYSLISSTDPFTGDGLIDLLPAGVSKAHAIDWWRQHNDFERTQVVFAGDSGNDWAALTAGYRAIVVSNADRELARRVQQHHSDQGWTNRLHLSTTPATSGVLEGCQSFGLFSADTA